MTQSDTKNILCVTLCHRARPADASRTGLGGSNTTETPEVNLNHLSTTRFGAGIINSLKHDGRVSGIFIEYK